MLLNCVFLALVDDCEVEDVAVDEVHRSAGALLSDALELAVGAVSQDADDKVEDDEDGTEDDEEFGAAL